MDRKQKDSHEQILINTMYTGDYTNKNIGHEIINLYATDKGDNYIYISPYGRIHKDRYSQVKTVLFARPAGTGMLEIIAKAEDLTPLNEDPVLYSEDKKTEKAKKKEQEEILKKDFYLVQAGKYCEIKELKDKTLDYCKKEFENTIISNNKKSKEDLNKDIKEWIKLRPLNIAHRQLIKDDKIKYGGVYLNEIFSNNERNDCSSHFTFKSKKVTKAKRHIYFNYSKTKSNETTQTEKSVTSANSGSMSNKEHNNVRYIGKSEDECAIIYKFENIIFRNTSCMKYIKEENYDDLRQKELNDLEKKSGEKYIYAVLKKIIEEKDNWSDKEEIKPIGESSIEQFEPCFMDIVGKQHEELAYSNMFAHFFKEYPDIFEKFVREVLSRLESNPENITKLKEFEIGNTFEIGREVKNIDIIIYTENDIFVIENKIKSHINGTKYIKKETNNNSEAETGNKNSEKKKSSADDLIIYTNQLIKYYDYVETEGEKKGKVTHYYIFKPNYNKIDDELKEIKNKNNIIKQKLDKYKILDYSEIKEFYEKTPSVKEKDLYFKEFVKALKKHSNKTDNIIEMEMGYKFRQAINKMKQKEGNNNASTGK